MPPPLLFCVGEATRSVTKMAEESAFAVEDSTGERGFGTQGHPHAAKIGAAAASRPPHATNPCCHTSCGRLAASAHSKDWLSHELRPLRGLRTYSELLLSHELRPLCGLRTQQRLALTRAAAASRPPHTTSSCCHMSCDRFAAYAQNKL